MEYPIVREETRRRILRLSVVIVLLLLLIITKPFVIVRAGEVGVIYSFGSIIGQVEEGFHLIAPWHFVTHTNIRVQRAVLDRLQSFSQETQDVFVCASLNFQVPKPCSIVSHGGSGLLPCADRAAGGAELQG